MVSPVEEDREAIVPLRVGILAGTALGSIVLSPILVFFEALIGLIALVAGGAMGAGPTRTPGRQARGGDHHLDRHRPAGGTGVLPGSVGHHRTPRLRPCR